jgi:HPt (histidine-containing phosphotransfer) domain-containing protein
MTSPFPIDYEAQVLARYEGDKEMLREVAQLFVDDSPQVLEAVRAAVASRDPKAIHRTAHTLKGTVSNFLAAEDVTGGDDPAQEAATAALVLERMASAGQLQQIDAALASVESTVAQLRKRLQAIIAA